MTTPAFGFTKLVVCDLEAEERFYCDVFGMKPLRRVSTDEHKFALDEVILSFGDHTNSHPLIITRYRDRSCPPAGSAWTGFVVTDLTATLVSVECNGGKVEVSTHKNAEHGVLAAIAADPEGHLIEIIQITSVP